jgi:riboflavin kinase/FMN adenylyltransferase
LHNLRDRHRGCVLSIGNFDGFHRGHQALIARLREHARRLRVPAAVQIFEPTPREVFAKDGAPGRCATFRGKLAALEKAGVERVLCVRFGRNFAAIAAEDYVNEVLVKKLGVKAVVVGDDFRFGAGRGGDLALLQALGAKLGFIAESLPTVAASGARASSSALRESLAKPDFARAAELLGRPYSILGRVRRGAQLGRKLGMPTVNIHLHKKPALRFGVYAVRVTVNGRSFEGVANVGIRPAIGTRECLLEAHLFDFNGDLYGEVVDVEFVKFLRDEAKFDSMEALAAQMQRDGAEARAVFGSLDTRPAGGTRDERA